MPEDVPTLQLAIGQARPGDTIVLAAGTYPGGNVVPQEKRDVTIRGVDRNTVVLDGGDTRRTGSSCTQTASRSSTCPRTTSSRTRSTGRGANRFRASYLTVWNVREYGIYIEDGEQGAVDNDYVSGAARAAYYVGECRPCGQRSRGWWRPGPAVGYSGTNATG